MNTVWIPVVIQIIISLGTLAGGLLLIRRTNAEAKKLSAESASIERTVEQKAIELAERTYKSLIESLQRQIKDQEAGTDELEKKTQLQDDKTQLLLRQIEQLQEVNRALLATNVTLQNQVKQCDSCDKLFGKEK